MTITGDEILDRQVKVGFAAIGKGYPKLRCPYCLKMHFIDYYSVGSDCDAICAHCKKKFFFNKGYTPNELLPIYCNVKKTKNSKYCGASPKK